VTKREWQIEMANRFAKRDNVLDTRSYLLGRYDSTKELTDEEISAVWASKKYDGEHFVDYIQFARDLLRKAQEK
jgi:hypothetical protein